MEKTLASSNRSQREPDSPAVIMGISVLERIQSQRSVPLPLLLCMYSGMSIPPYCTKMERTPDPKIGQKLTDLPNIITDIINYNPAVHDGAIIARQEGSDYTIAGWSYRLYPPPIDRHLLPNRGSAYNSCSAMSDVKGVDAVLILGSKGISVFVYGQEYALRSGKHIDGLISV